MDMARQLIDRATQKNFEQKISAVQKREYAARHRG
jgi:hypothetical protein